MGFSDRFEDSKLACYGSRAWQGQASSSSGRALRDRTEKTIYPQQTGLVSRAAEWSCDPFLSRLFPSESADSLASGAILFRVRMIDPQFVANSRPIRFPARKGPRSAA